MITNENIYFIVNPNAKSGMGSKIWTQVYAQLKANHMKMNEDYVVLFTQAPADASRIAGQLSDPALYANGKSSLVLGIIGGDGTLNEIINGLHIESSPYIRIIYIPAGSGNDFSRSTQMGIDAEHIIDALKDCNHCVEFDYGCMEIIKPVKNQRRFIESAGIGYDAAVCHSIHKSATKSFFNQIGFGKLAYTFLGILEIIRCKPTDGWIETDQGKEHFKNMYFMSVHIQSYEGGGYKFAPDAIANDGLLDVCLVSGINKVQFVLYLFHVLFKKFEHTEGRFCKHYKTRKAKIHANRLKPVHCDGELMGYQNQAAFICRDGGVHIVGTQICK